MRRAQIVIRDRDTAMRVQDLRKQQREHVAVIDMFYNTRHDHPKLIALFSYEETMLQLEQAMKFFPENAKTIFNSLNLVAIMPVNNRESILDYYCEQDITTYNYLDNKVKDFRNSSVYKETYRNLTQKRPAVIDASNPQYEKLQTRVEAIKQEVKEKTAIHNQVLANIFAVSHKPAALQDIFSSYRSPKQNVFIDAVTYSVENTRRIFGDPEFFQAIPKETITTILNFYKQKNLADYGLFQELHQEMTKVIARRSIASPLPEDANRTIGKDLNGLSRISSHYSQGREDILLSKAPKKARASASTHAAPKPAARVAAISEDELASLSIANATLYSSSSSSTAPYAPFDADHVTQRASAPPPTFVNDMEIPTALTVSSIRAKASAPPATPAVAPAPHDVPPPSYSSIMRQYGLPTDGGLTMHMPDYRAAAPSASTSTAPYSSHFGASTSRALSSSASSFDPAKAEAEGKPLYPSLSRPE